MKRIMKCEYCGCDHTGTYGSGRFCSYVCKQKYVHYSRSDFSCKNKKPAVCNVCGKRFSSVLDFRKHRIEEKHFSKRGPKSDRSWVCKICNAAFPSRRTLQRHKIETKHYYPIADTEKWSKAVSSGLRLFYDNESEEHKQLRVKKSKEIVKQHPDKFKGGITHGGGRGKHGWYRNIWCDSSWELAYVIYCIEHGVSIERYTGSFPYKYRGTNRTYHPDFLVSGSEIVEIKGYETDQWKAKLNQLPSSVRIIVIGPREIGQYIRYAVKKYGRDFIRLYDKGEVAESV